MWRKIKELGVTVGSCRVRWSNFSHYLVTPEPDRKKVEKWKKLTNIIRFVQNCDCFGSSLIRSGKYVSASLVFIVLDICCHYNVGQLNESS